MSSKTGSFTKVDILKDMIWTLISMIAFFIYLVVFLLVITFVFNSIIKLSFQAIVIISIVLTIGMLLYRIIKTLIKYTKG